MALLDQSTVLALDNKSIAKKDIITLLGSVDDDDLFDLANLISHKQPSEAIDLLKKIIDKGNDPIQLMKELIGYFRNLMLASACQKTEEVSKLLDISPENCEKIFNQAKTFSSQELSQIIESLAQQERNIRNSSNPYLYLDVAIINVATRENIIAEKALLERIENLENMMKAGYSARASFPKLQHQEASTSQNKAQPEIKIEQEQTKPAEQPKIQEVQKSEINQEKVNEEPVGISKNETEKTEIEEKTQAEIEPTKSSSNLIELNWDTFLGEVQNANPALHGLLKMQARPITLNSDKIELAFKIDAFIEKVKKKQDLLSETAKNLCGKIPVFIFRKISEADFKKKIADTPKVNEEPKFQPESHIEENPSKEEIEEMKQIPPQKKESFSKFDLPEDTAQIMEIFSGKFID